MNQSHKNNQPTNNVTETNDYASFGINIALEVLFGNPEYYHPRTQLHIANRLTEVLDDYVDGEEFASEVSFILSRLRSIHESIGETCVHESIEKTFPANSLVADEEEEIEAVDWTGPLIPITLSTTSMHVIGGGKELTVHCEDVAQELIRTGQYERLTGANGA